ncbi:MAG: DUF2283 domain-containing protein [Spirochaetota bacterium]
MQVSYDPTYNIAYIRLREKAENVETIKISDELSIDVAPDGRVCGLELMNANEQLGINAKEPFQFINEKSHRKVELPLGI